MTFAVTTKQIHYPFHYPLKKRCKPWNIVLPLLRRLHPACRCYFAPRDQQKFLWNASIYRSCRSLKSERTPHSTELAFNLLVNEDKLILVVSRTGSHADLFNL
ncbi:hypothetical protein HMPREF3232_00248 [Fannyhessea vaginae]|nr:hypothetical protein HMPREF3232_00248 [Fannyhessea vaginae]